MSSFNLSIFNMKPWLTLIPAVAMIAALAFVACNPEDDNPAGSAGTGGESASSVNQPSSESQGGGGNSAPALTAASDSGATAVTDNLTDLSRLSGDIAIDGSSTVFPITEAVAEEFGDLTGGNVRTVVGISGTGGGFKKFCTNETVISDASQAN